MTSRLRMWTLAGALAAGAATPALAGKIVVPEGCEAFLSVQMKECGVSHYWRCNEGPEGAVWEVHYDADGAFSMSVYSAEFQWLDSRYFADGTREHLVEEGPDPASLSELLDTGRDTYAFVIRETGPNGARDVVHQGYDRLTGRTVTIDGTELLETEFASTAMDAESGETVYEVFGNQFVLADERLFFLGPDTFRQDGEERENDASPLLFIRPGETNFGDTMPQFGCEGAEEIVFRPAPAAAARP
ncbi:hypothetical protein [Tropicimonas sp.]|uniref:hypothetical protein n=1 Tax=Tropicimonas sp. TaxID=2067044 RepID=UPI003A8B4C8A